MTEEDVWALLSAAATADGITESKREEQPGPLGTRVLIVQATEGGYPGSSRWTAIYDGQTAYGGGSGRSAADFLRSRKLRPADVSAGELVELLRWITFGGALVVRNRPAPAVERAGSDALLRFTELDPMSGKRFPVIVRIPAFGDEVAESDSRE